YGLDLSQKMIDCATQKIPHLNAVVDTAAHLDRHFPEQTFDLISTHFISGFVPLELLAAKVSARLADGGYWSYLGATKQSFPGLQALANKKVLRWLFGAPRLDVDADVLSPAHRQEVAETLERHGFVIRESETFEPPVYFGNLDEFLEFAY